MCLVYSIAFSSEFRNTIEVYGVVIVPDRKHRKYGRLVVVTEAGVMNALELFQNYRIPTQVGLRFFAHVAKDLCHLHERKIIHHDVKPENILITKVSLSHDVPLYGYVYLLVLIYFCTV